MKTPICSHCRRRREECNYNDGSGSQAGLVPSFSTEAATISTTSSSTDAVDANAILTHYMDVTSGEMWLLGEDRDDEFNPWRDELAPLLQTLPFLYHMIISLSALHMYHRISGATTRYNSPVHQPEVNGSPCGNAGVDDRGHGPFSSTYSPKPLREDSRRSPPATQSSSSDILTVAYSNQILGSKTFRQAVPSIDANNWIPVMAFTIAVLVFCLYNCQQSTTFSGVVAGTLAALRTAGVMGNELKPFFLGSGAFGEHLMSRARRSAPKITDPAILVALAHLRTINEERKVADSRERAEQTTCARAISSLQRWVVLVSGKPRSWAHYVWWPADVPTEFIDLVNEKNPVALLVFVYWCAVLGRADQQWFLNGWASKAGGVAMAEMGPGWWDQGLDWPLQELGLCRGSVKIGDLSKGEMLVRL
ncbi:hypothetical protein F4777DRAFT_568292 [Nemania sp. FL0916]|nr:hypothetical protein F4777DRAFT_568292 [Nemania sp. FL0916]